MYTSLLKIAMGAALVGTQVCAFAQAESSTMPSPQPEAAAVMRAQQKLTHAIEVTDRFASKALAEGYTNDSWRWQLIANLMKDDQQDFARVESADSYIDALGVSARLGNANSSPEVARLAKSLGSESADLVYVPINPNRILDTRVGAAQSFAAGVPRNLGFSQNGGGSGVQTLSLYPGGVYPAALAVNVTVDETGLSGFPAGSYLAFYPQGGTAGSSFINFGPGQILANAGVISINQLNGLFTALSSAPANVIIDVYGVFVKPQATALDCGNTTGALIAIPAHGNAQGFSNTCPTNYAMVGGGCFGNVFGVNLSSASPSGDTRFVCNWQSTLGTDTTGYAYARCCRTPGW